MFAKPLGQNLSKANFKTRSKIAPRYAKIGSIEFETIAGTFL